MWLLSTRQWEITKDWHYKIDKDEYVIPAGFTFDGASIPKFLRSFFSPVGVLLMGGLVHDYGYKYATLLKKNKKETIKAIKILNTINNPKSIIGLISLMIREAKATIVVSAV